LWPSIIPGCTRMLVRSRTLCETKERCIGNQNVFFSRKFFICFADCRISNNKTANERRNHANHADAHRKHHIVLYVCVPNHAICYDHYSKHHGSECHDVVDQCLVQVFWLRGVVDAFCQWWQRRRIIVLVSCAASLSGRLSTGFLGTGGRSSFGGWARASARRIGVAMQSAGVFVVARIGIVPLSASREVAVALRASHGVAVGV